MQAVHKQAKYLKNITSSIFDIHATDFWLQKINPVWSVKSARVKIINKKIVAKDTVSLTLKSNRHVQLGEAGQHHPVKVTIAGRNYERSYSLTERNGNLILTVKKVADGKVSTWLVEKSKVGDVIEIGQPFGDMKIKQQDRIILLAAGSGITPMRSLIEGLKRNNQLKQRSVKLLYWVKKYDDAAFLNEFNDLAASYPSFKFDVFYTQEAEQQERLNIDHLAELDDLEHSTVFACGPSGFVNIAEELFGQAHIFMSEAFSLSKREHIETGVVQVTLAKSKKVVEIPRGQSILDGLEQANIKPTYGCRMGVCHKCVCQKVEGSTKNLLDTSENSEPNNMLKICVNSAQTDLVIDL